MIKILIFVASMGVLYLLAKSKLKKLFGGGEEKAEPKAVTTDMERDPICDTYVQQETPYKLKYREKIYYFCSQECKDKFKKLKVENGG